MDGYMDEYSDSVCSPCENCCHRFRLVAQLLTEFRDSPSAMPSKNTTRKRPSEEEEEGRRRRASWTSLAAALVAAQPWGSGPIQSLVH